MKMSNFDRKYSPGNRHMICIGKTKTTSEKGLFNDCVNTMAFRCIVYLFFFTTILHSFNIRCSTFAALTENKQLESSLPKSK